jgi:hypothetical protein
VNFSIGLDGTTSMPQLLQFWDAEWSVAKLFRWRVFLQLLVRAPSSPPFPTRAGLVISVLVIIFFIAFLVPLFPIVFRCGTVPTFRYARELLIEPNLSLLPPDYAEGTRHDPAALAAAGAHGGWPEQRGGEWHEALHPIVRGSASDLRRKKGRNRFLAEIVYLFCEQRARYDAAAKEFSEKYAEKAKDDWL